MRGLEDILPFGKHKGSRVSEILKQDASYLCWLRETNKADGKADQFTVDVHDAVDAAISASKQLQRKYTPWNKKKVDLQDVMAASKAKGAAAEVSEVTHELAYAGEWASW